MDSFDTRMTPTDRTVAAATPAPTGPVGPEGGIAPEATARRNGAPVPPLGRLDVSRIDAVLFDIDGTLMDSDDAAIAKWSARLHPLWWLFPRRDPTGFLRRALMSGEGFLNPAIAALDVLGLGRTVVWLRRRAQIAIGCGDGACPAVLGVEPMLHALHQRYRLGIVTSRPRGQTEPFLARRGLSELFGALVTQESTRRLKPFPDPVLLAADLLGVSPTRCVLVGDTAVDVMAARRAGAQSVGVLSGMGDFRDLRRADLVLATTADLAGFLL
jgi:N-acetyl-D-muramate 6-phosphate phosphatase